MMAVLLDRIGYKVATAESMASGLQLARHERFDLYLLDTHLPDGTGEDLCRKIREFDQQTPTIFYSAEARQAQKQRSLGFGAQDYIVKPEISALPAAIARMIHPS